jgi:hypothetical protein
VNITRAFNAAMRERRADYASRPVPQVAARLNRAVTQRHLAEHGVLTLRAPSRIWSPEETSRLVNVFLVQYTATPQWVRVDGDRIDMSSEFERALVLSAQRSGIARSYEDIVSKVRRSKQLLDPHLRRRGG